MSDTPEPLVIELEMGTPTLHWCESCQVSTVLSADILIMGDSGVAHAGTIHKCERCGGA